jgi:hypothetical protein
MGLAVSVTTHWASEAAAGELIGYAIGKTTGRSYRRLLSGAAEDPRISFYAGINPWALFFGFKFNQLRSLLNPPP